MGKNKKRKRASKHLEEIVRMQKMKLQQQQQQQPEAGNGNGNGQDNDDDHHHQDTMILISNSKPPINTNPFATENDDINAEQQNQASSPSIQISQRHLDITIQTLQRIPPELMASSTACRDLRRALHPHVLRQMKSYETVDYRVKVTTALTQRQWPIAFQALGACRDFQQIPKQGTVQRWVRDCNDGPPNWKLKLLTAILSLGNGSNCTSSNNDNNGGGGPVDNLNQHDPGQALASAAASTSDEELIILEPWCVPSSSSSFLAEDQEKETQETKPLPEFSIPDSQRMIIYREEASERKPPNKYDLLLHYTPTLAAPLLDNNNNNDAMIMTSTSATKTIQKHEIDFLRQPDGVTTPFILEHVLTREECRRFMAAATTLGYRPDHPVSLEKPTGIDSCEWLLDEKTMETLLNRVTPYLPSTIEYNNKKVSYPLHSINKRWRFFRYARECVYRPHIDGSWPASFVEKTSDDNDQDKVEYRYTTESSATTKETRSYLTFLMYLNDDFTGGQTRFYQPTKDGKMSARGVQPKQGSVLVFPQGNTASLIHEGSAVTEGTKYVVRTDVIYVQKDEQD